MRFYTVGTAGHVDHGKSTLVKALTGEDPDRLPEEKARGMTIDLGFVHADLGDGIAITFIDVPGHERFLKTAIAGVAGIDLALFVIAADEGIMPQTREHLAILKHVGLTRGVVALTKTDMVEDDWLALVQDDVKEFFQGSFLEGAPLMPVSSTAGTGIESLRAELKKALAGKSTADANGPFRMAIDRVFTLRGFGTIIGGTVATGQVRTKDELEIQPLGKKVRIRGIQSRRADVTAATPGMRAALNIVGVEQDEIARGYEIAAPGLLMPTRRLDLALTVDQGPLAHRAPVRFNKGTAESLGRILILDAAEGETGRRHYAQIILEDPIVASRYEPFVIRNPSTMRLIGGGKILDVFPTPHRRQAWVVAELAKIEAAEHDPAALLQTLFTRAKGPRRAYRLAELAAATGLSRDELKASLARLLAEETAAAIGPDYIPGQDYPPLQQTALDVIRRALERDPLREAVSRDEVRTRIPYNLSAEGCGALLDALTAAGRLEPAGGGFRIAGYKSELSAPHREALAVIENLFQMDPPLRGRDEVEELLATYAEGTTMLKYALARGKLILLPENLIAPPAYVDAQKEALIAHLLAHETTRAADYKDVVNLSRKQATALLDYFQLAGVTIREAGTHRLAPKYRPAAEA